MKAFLFVLLISPSIYLALNIIPATNFKKFTINIDNKYSDSILSFSHFKIFNSSTYSIILNIIAPFGKYNLYIYDDLTKLNSDIEEKKFKNNIKHELITGTNEPYLLESTFINNDKTTLYFFFENNLEEKVGNINLTIFSEGSSFSSDDIILNEISCDGSSYSFNFPENHKGYLLFGFNDASRATNGRFEIFEGLSSVATQKITFINYLNDFYPLKQGRKYKIKLTCQSSGRYTYDNKKYYYLVQTNYYDNFEVKINTYDFQKFLVFRKKE